MESRVLLALLMLGLVALGLGCNSGAGSGAGSGEDPNDLGSDEEPEPQSGEELDPEDQAEQDEVWEECGTDFCTPDYRQRNGRHNAAKLSTGVEAATPKECCEICAKDESCKEFNFLESKGKCFLHSAKARRGPPPVEGYWSGKCKGGSNSKSSPSKSSSK